MRFLAVIGVIAILAIIGAAIYFFGGYYSVAAAEPNPGIVDWALERIREASVEHHAVGSPPTRMDDPVVVKDGAWAFSQFGCVNCHGAPGVKWAKFSEGLRPDPPDLKDAANELEPAQIFWVVKNGIEMTGMPSFGLIGADDKEIWAIAAFVKKLPTVSPDEYRAWSMSR
jgi:mono/diheme cytochrome c family protein